MTTEKTLASITLMGCHRPHPTMVGGEAGFTAVYSYEDGSTRTEGFAPAHGPRAACQSDPQREEAAEAAATLGFQLGAFASNTGWLLIPLPAGVRDDAEMVRRGETLLTTVWEHAQAVHAAVPGSTIRDYWEHGTLYYRVQVED